MSRWHVQILMATRDGAPYLEAQLASFVDQSHRNWSLLVGDDASRDATPDILKEFAPAPVCEDRTITVLPGPGQGVAANFLSLVRYARPGAYLAFSDQDDVWMPHKLERALDQLDGAGPGGVYVSRTVLTDASLAFSGLSALPPRGVSFGNALVQNVLGGNTIVLAPEAAARLAESVPAALAAGVPFHDWWVYQLAAGAGLPIVVDPEPGLYYRQHGRNVLGARRGVLADVRRIGRLVDRNYSGWIARNVAALTACRPLLDPTGRRLLEAFTALRDGPPAPYASGLKRLGIHRQRPAEDRLLWALARTGRL